MRTENKIFRLLDDTWYLVKETKTDLFEAAAAKKLGFKGLKTFKTIRAATPEEVNKLNQN